MTVDQKQLAQIDQWLDSGDAKRAEAQIARLLRSDCSPAERAELLLRRARTRVFTARPDEAIEDLQTLHALMPDLWERSEVQELLGDAYFSRFELAPVGFAERSDAVRARVCYQSIEERDPNYANMGWAMYQWGRILLTEDNIEQAIEKFTEALVKPSTVPRLTALCYERLGFIHLIEKRDPATALSYFSRAVTTYPSGEAAGWMMRLHLLRSRALREQNRFDEALQAAQAALQAVSPWERDYRAVLTDAHLAVGEMLASMPGRAREAADHLVQYLQHSRRPQGVDVTWSRIHETLGALWFRLERYDQAITAYHTALTFNPYHPWEISLQYQIARSHFRLREYEKAIAAIEHMLKLAEADHQPITNYGVYGVLGSAHFALEHYSEARVAFEKAVELAPPDAENADKFKTYLKASQDLPARR